jgi:hypothetical protein
MSCQGPDGLKVICRLPELVNVFVLLSESVLEIEKSNIFADNPEYQEGFHVLYRLAHTIAKKLNDLSAKLNKYRDYLVKLINQKATEKTRPLLLQKVTTIMQDLRQEMSKLAPKLRSEKRDARDVGNKQAVANTRRLLEAQRASTIVDARAETPLYRNAVPTDEDLLEPQTELDKMLEVGGKGSHGTAISLADIKELFAHFHVIARAETSLVKLEQEISDFLTEILLLFQEEIVELKMLIRMCQSSMTGSDQDKDKRVLSALNAVKKFMREEPEEDFEIQQMDCSEKSSSYSKSWRIISNGFMSAPKIMA